MTLAIVFAGLWVVTMFVAGWQASKVNDLQNALNGQPKVKAKSIPTFTTKEKCVICRRPFDRLGTELNTELNVNNVLMPATLKICEDCVDRA